MVTRPLGALFFCWILPWDLAARVLQLDEQASFLNASPGLRNKSTPKTLREERLAP